MKADLFGNRRGLFLALTLGLMAMFASIGPALAQNAIPGGGFSGPGPAIITVEQAKTMSDDAKVALRGNIIQNLGGENYVFKDGTGTITVDIDDKRWRGQNIGPDDEVVINGEIEKDWSSVKIDVDSIVKQ